MITKHCPLRLALGLLFLSLIIAACQARAAPGDVDLSFDAGSVVSNSVHTVVLQGDGKVLVGGPFGSISASGTNHAVARLNTDGSLDGSFNATVGAELAEVNFLA